VDLIERGDRLNNLAAGLGRWFEVVTPTHQQVAERLTGPRARWSVTPMLSVPKEFELPPGVLEEFPFFWGHGLWMSDEVYATLVHDLHPEHFSSQDLRPVG